MKTKYNATDRIPRRIVTPTLLLAGEILIQIPKSPSINNDNGFADLAKISISIEAADGLVSIPNQPFNLKLEMTTSLGVSDIDHVYLDFEVLKFPLRFDNWSHGDYFYPSGMSGKKKLSKYFKDEKLSLINKENIRVIYSGNDVVWIVGRRADQRFLANKNSSQILKLSIEHNAHS